MPIAFDPEAVAWFSLEADLDKPEAKRPAFCSRFLTCRQALRVQELLRAWAGETRLEAQIALLTEALAIGLVDWRNVRDQFDQPIPFARRPFPSSRPSVDVERVVGLEDAYTLLELAEIVRQYIAAVSEVEWRLKNPLPSPSASSTGPSAPAAAATPATPPAAA